MFIWPERNNILDFDALHFGIIKYFDDEVLIIIYILTLRKPLLLCVLIWMFCIKRVKKKRNVILYQFTLIFHTGTFQCHLIELMVDKVHLDS
jgi:hypothetical protein